MKVVEMTLLTLMPTSMAMVRSWAVARIALPIRVNLMTTVRISMMIAVVIRIIRSEEPTICATGSMKANSGMSSGNGRKSEVWASST